MFKFQFSKIFTAPVPKWRGPEFISSKQFLRAYVAYEASEKGYIKTKQLKQFLKMLFSEGKCKKVDPKMLKEFKKSYISHMTTVKNQRWISFNEIYTTLVKMIKYNFLLQYQGRRKYTITDLMNIWRHYDSTCLGYMQKSSAEVFAFDLLTDVKQKTKPKVIRALAKKLSTITGGSNGEIELSGMNKILPLETDIAALFPFREKINWEEFDFTFEVQDKYGCGVLTLVEVRTLLQRICDKFGKGSGREQIEEQMMELTTLANNSHDGVLYKEDLRVLLSCRNREEVPPMQYLQHVDFP